MQDLEGIEQGVNEIRVAVDGREECVEFEWSRRTDRRLQLPKDVLQPGIIANPKLQCSRC
jgi:hypothetical protein